MEHLIAAFPGPPSQLRPIYLGRRVGSNEVGSGRSQQVNPCYADMDVTADFGKSLRSGKQIVVGLARSGRTDTGVSVALAGFGTVYDGPGTSPSTSNQDQNALTSSLQAHDDAARQALTNPQQPPKQ